MSVPSPQWTFDRHEILSAFESVPEHVFEEIVDTIFLPLVR
ncbi:hypothetical protein AB0H00_07055 [Nocardia sp. NPDC023852]